MKVVKGYLWTIVIQAIAFGMWYFVIAHSSLAHPDATRAINAVTTHRHQ
jgi:predicted secreted protein